MGFKFLIPLFLTMYLIAILYTLIFDDGCLTANLQNCWKCASNQPSRAGSSTPRAQVHAGGIQTRDLFKILLNYYEWETVMAILQLR